MKLVDANVLLYAVNSASTHHEASRRWLDGALSGSDSIGFAWLPMLAFVRLSTKIGLFPSPLAPSDAIRQVLDWTTAPGATTIGPTARHGDILHGLLARSGTGGNLVNDAHLAALAIEHRASIVSYDSDFRRFEGIRLDTPETLLADKR
ncbi:type II toxin-antitoxin system VapC family toxin [Mycolicibacterium novocastrense]|uniref:Ribonuclease VapC n=1 Tax=Mycolicibacterium novocastrense TaxID=59813 RepID=A0AAW5SNW6_MYCNV|nr:type II toxin-antitoxin system VapC family toxin [Mycolicibacterium novocastrense]MCV7025489.1 type II toxin-antitoxin system VapC family toxin [Mycolicibacterium novocastrense]GAT08955.1 PilT domain-containing protein [Mycolicibacterium novocastrense]